MFILVYGCFRCAGSYLVLDMRQLLYDPDYAKNIQAWLVHSSLYTYFHDDILFWDPNQSPQPHPDVRS